MDVAELVLKYIQVLIWPSVTLALFWAWRERVGEAIGRLSRVETPAGALEFQNEVRRVRDRAEAAAGESAPTGAVFGGPPPAGWPTPAAGSSSRPGTAGGTGPGPGAGAGVGATTEPRSSEESPFEAVRRRLPLLWSAIDQPDDVIDHSPTGAIVSAWNAVQTFAEEILILYPAVRLQRPLGQRVPPDDLVRMLHMAGLNQSWADVLNDLHRLRDTTVHGSAPVTPQAARDFVQGCKSVCRALEDLIWAAPFR
ncbi:hypothetical protein [Streptomyces sp. NPDC047024]|uniref:hypothetical protein n=1 Tax=Streptomyces sp. NPDC047024 TaxID=3155476 RepID=UPI00340077E6